MAQSSSPLIYFVRHGQTDWNAELRLQGQQDIPINATGRLQAAHNGETLARLMDDPQRFRYVASPLGRTRETMEIVREKLNLPKTDYETDDRLKEISFGSWEGYTMAELRVDNAQAVEEREGDKFNFIPPKGESYAQLLVRIRNWLPSVTEDACIVCHGGVIRTLDHHLNGTPVHEAVHTNIPQDKIFRWDGEKAVWL